MAMYMYGRNSSRSGVWRLAVVLVAIGLHLQQDGFDMKGFETKSENDPLEVGRIYKDQTSFVVLVEAYAFSRISNNRSIRSPLRLVRARTGERGSRLATLHGSTNGFQHGDDHKSNLDHSADEFIVPSGTGMGYRQSEYIPLIDSCDLWDENDNGETMRISQAHRQNMIALPFWQKINSEAVLNILIPTIVVPVLAFMSYDVVASNFKNFVDVLSANKWVPADGGAYRAQIFTPALNGVVVQAIAVLFATLTSTTVSSLRERQNKIRIALNIESGELRALECLVDSMPEGSNVQYRCRNYMIQYTMRLIKECDPALGTGEHVVHSGRGMDSELNGFLLVLGKEYGHHIPRHIGDGCYVALAKLREQRKIRITALQSTFPPLHYITLAVLAFSECFAFLIETDQDVLIFLNALQLKLMWSMLVGTFASCFTIFLDMARPFSGSYQISTSLDHLHTILMQLRASAYVAESATRTTATAPATAPQFLSTRQD